MGTSQSNTQSLSVQKDAVVDIPEQNFTWASMVPVVLICFVMYFLLIRPQEKKRKEHERLLSDIKVGDEVITVGGIMGKIVKIDDKTNIISLEIAKDTSIKILRSAISDLPKKLTK